MRWDFYEKCQGGDIHGWGFFFQLNMPAPYSFLSQGDNFFKKYYLNSFMRSNEAPILSLSLYLTFFLFLFPHSVLLFLFLCKSSLFGQTKFALVSQTIQKLFQISTVRFLKPHLGLETKKTKPG